MAAPYGLSNIVDKKTILLTPPTFVKSLWTVLPLAAGSINYDSRAGRNVNIKPCKRFNFRSNARKCIILNKNCISLSRKCIRHFQVAFHSKFTSISVLTAFDS